MKKTKTEMNERQKSYRNSPAGRAAAKRGSKKRSEKRRLIAANKPKKVSGIRIYDSHAVQQTLMRWGG